MTKIDFYQLSNTDSHQRNLFLCKLIEKIYLKRHQLYIHCKNMEEAQLLDELLWIFKDTSFIPHNLIGEGPDEAPPIQLGCTAPPNHRDILINLAEQIPAFSRQFKRVLEIKTNSNEDEISYQQHLVHYQQHSTDITTHNINQEKKAHAHG